MAGGKLAAVHVDAGGVDGGGKEWGEAVGFQKLLQHRPCRLLRNFGMQVGRLSRAEVREEELVANAVTEEATASTVRGPTPFRLRRGSRMG